MKLPLYAGVAIAFGSLQTLHAQDVAPNISPKMLKGETEYTTDTGPKKLKVKVDEGICFLTLVSGNFQGFGESVYITEEAGYYVLTGNIGVPGKVKARARCISYGGSTKVTE